MNAMLPREPRTAPQPPPPPLHASPLRIGNGRIEVQVYPAATQNDRIAMAALLLRDTPFIVTRRHEAPGTGSAEG